MRNFQDTFETRQQSFTSAFSICMTVPLSMHTFQYKIVRDSTKYSAHTGPTFDSEFFEALYT